MKRAAKLLGVAAFWLALWALLAHLVDKPLLLPAPWVVFARLGELGRTGSFWGIVGASLLRILCGMLCAVPAGALLAAATARCAPLRALLSPLLTAIKSTPVASFIILALIWMGREILPAFIAFLMVLPLVWTNVSAGIQAVDTDLLEMARVFHLPRGRVLLRIYLPGIAPYFLSACKAALGLAWKAGIAAEVLTVPARSVGAMLYNAKLYLDTPGLFAWTLVVILCSLLIEKVLMAAVGRLGKRYDREGGKP